MDAGYVTESAAGGFGDAGLKYISEAGITALETWAETEFPGEVEFNYGYVLTNPMQQFMGSGDGTVMIAPETGLEASQIAAVMIDSADYPMYGEVRTNDGTLLNEAITSPTDVIVDAKIAEILEVNVGDTVRIAGSTEDFTVQGVVRTEAEVKDPFSGLLIGLWGFYYIDNTALPLFGGDITPQVEKVSMRLANPDNVSAVNESLLAAFPYFDTTTTVELEQQNEQIAGTLNQLVSLIGIISLLIGSIGIINTMQVIVRRRMLEIAVLKTIGLQADQTTLLFLTEAFLMGVIGSIAGIVLGWLASIGLQQIAEGIYGQEFAFRIAAAPAINGLVVGTVVATIFGLLPTLSAGQVRPGVVLRPDGSPMPRAGFLRLAAAFVVIVAALSLITSTILGDLGLSFALTLGALVAAGVIYVLLSVFIWIVGRIFPSFGVVDLKISLRQMLAGRSRSATTLLALVVGVFSLSLITLFSQAINNIMTVSMEGVGGNVMISAQSEAQREQIETMLADFEGLNGYSVTLSYDMALLSVEKADGTTLMPDDLLVNLTAGLESEMEGMPGGGGFDTGEFAENMLSDFDTIVAVSAAQNADANYAAGRALTEADAGENRIVLVQDDAAKYAGFEVGDKLTYEFAASGLFNRNTGDPVTLEVVGIIQPEPLAIDMSNSSFTTVEGTFDQAASGVSFLVDVEEDRVGALRREITAIPGTFMIETSIFTTLIESLIGAFTAFPTLVAALGLIVGGVVIANSVALSTMERRREIAVMKSVGLQRERVLFMLLLENGILGLMGGLVGVGIGVVALVILVTGIGIPLSAVPFATAFLLMLLCVSVALIAALTTAWDASGEKPLNVLRYE